MKKSTIIRLITLILVLVNQILCSTGVLNFEFAEENIYELVSIIVTTITTLWCAWKNNSFTKNAQLADEYLESLRVANKKGTEEVEGVIDED